MAAGLFLWWGSTKNYLVFQAFTEVWSVVIACFIGVLGLIPSRGQRNTLAAGLSVTYLGVAVIGVFHMLAYRGTGIFPGSSENPAAHFWVLARYVESLGLLATVLFHRRRGFLPLLAAATGGFTALGTAMVFQGHFPDAFLSGTGLTFFRVGSEHVVSVVLLFTSLLIYRSKDASVRPFREALLGSLLLTVGSELVFTLNRDAYGVTNMAGHLLKVASFYVLLVGVVIKTVRDPLFTVYLPILQAQETFLGALSGPSFLLDDKGRIVVSNLHVPPGTHLDSPALASPMAPVREWIASLSGGAGEASRTLQLQGRELSGSLKALSDEKGRPAGLAFVSVDISEKRFRERQVQRLSSIVENSLNEIYLMNPDTFGFEYVNRGALESLGYTEEQMYRMTAPDIMPLFTPESFREALEPLLSGEYKNLSFQTSHRRNGGAEYDVALTLQLIGKGPERKLVGIGLNVTEKAEVERRLLETNAELEQLFRNAPMALFLCDEHGMVQKANPGVLELFGYTEKEAVGRTIEDLIVPERELEASLGHWDYFASRKKPLNLEAERRRKDGTLIPVRCIGVPVLLKGEVRGSYLLYQDVTAQRRYEASIRRMNLELGEKVEALREAWEQTILILAASSEAKDPYTAGHQREVSRLSEAVALEMGLGLEEARRVGLAAMVHDIGKIEVPSEILSRPGRLGDIERKLIETHAEAGRRILKDIALDWPLAEIVHQHHERMDGSGYPRGLSDGQILPEARIIAVADTVEAMSAHRPYRPALGVAPALEEIRRGRGTAFDSAVVDACLRVFEKGSFSFVETAFGQKAGAEEVPARE